MPSITVDLTPDGDKTLDKIAKETNMSRVQVAGDLLNGNLKAEKERYDQLERGTKR